MQTIDVNSWDEFEAKIEELKERYGKRHRSGVDVKNTIVYRGQAGKWPKLKTTLERYSPREWTVSEYANLVLGLAPQVKSFTKKCFDPPLSASPVTFTCSSPWSFALPDYEYWVHLRQYGFPSPLLDWTESPYIAAFFAMEKKNAERPSVFVYVDKPAGSKVCMTGSTNISLQGPCGDMPERHFRQKGWYTVCTTQLKNNDHKFSYYEDVFAKDQTRHRHKQEVLVKIALPGEERLDFLRHLQKMKITASDLFRTKVALMQTLAVQASELDAL